MSEIKIKPALNTLPPELIGLMIPDPAVLDVTVTDNLVRRQRWLPFKYDWEEKYVCPDESDLQEMLEQLRTLSHVCRSLRAVALQRLWAVVHVKTVHELATLADILSDAPYIAPLIRHFSFMWEMNGDVSNCRPFAKRHGSMLDMAFIDRGELWDKTRAMYRAEIDLEFDEGDELVYTMFKHNGVEYPEPGEPPEWWEDYPEGTELTPEQCEEAYARRGPNLDREGCDGRGEDKRIKEPQDLISCISDVVAQLTSLEAFRWCCTVFPMPEGVFQAVKKLENLKTLHIDMVSRRGSVHSLPFWELTSQIQHLSIQLCDFEDEEEWSERPPCEEASEEELMSFDLPRRIPATKVKINALHEKIASRTVITAARGGRLKTLEIRETSLQLPFAVRALLPLWIETVCDTWHSDRRYRWPNGKWLAARASLRAALAHSSLWLPITGSLSRNDRLLTGEEVGSLAAHFKTRKMPRLIKPERDVTQNRMAKYPMSVHLYLDWLAQDSKLAEQVADAWNRVVERGEADLVKCCCKKCQPDLKAPPKPARYDEYMALFGIDPASVEDPSESEEEAEG